MLLLEKIEQQRKYIILILIACILVSVVYSMFALPKKQTAVSTLMLIEMNEDKSLSNGNMDLTEKMISNFEKIIRSESNIELLNESLNSNISVNELKNKIQVEGVSNSDTFKIIVNNEDLDLAKKINSKLIEIFSSKIETLFTNTEVYIVDSAHIETDINYYSIIKIVLMSIAFGIIINAIYIVVLIELDKKVGKTNELEAELALKNLARIPLYKNKNKIVENEKSNYASAFRTLRSNIQFVNVNNKGKNTILVTSPKKSEGKTLIASNLATTFAKGGNKVVLIDTDMKAGKIDKIFNLPNDLGLSNYLCGIDDDGTQINERINKFIKETSIKNLNIITSGTVPPNSSELLSMPKFEETLKDLSVFYDVVILDASRVLNETDALILTRLANSTILVSNYKKTKKDDLWTAKRDIQNVGGRIIGIIVNRVRVKTESEKVINKIKKILVLSLAFIKDKIFKAKDYVVAIRLKRQQKLLNAAKVEEKTEVVEEIKNNEEIKVKEESKKEEVKAERIFTPIILNSTDKDTVIIKDKKELHTKVEESKIVKNVNDIKVNKSAEVINEIKNEEIKQELKEDIKIEDVKEEIPKKKEVIEKLINIKSKVVEKSSEGLSKSKELVNKVKENSKKLIEKIEENKKVKNENNQVITLESKELINETEPKIEKEKNKATLSIERTNTISEGEANKPEYSVLVIIDPENGYARAFSQYCFTEKLIRGIDKTDGFVKAHYSTALINRKKHSIMSKYELTQKQVNRIDPLVYSILQEYDDCIWMDRKTTSNKAEDYIFCMTKEYDRTPDETKINHELRCQYLRKIELAKAQIEIEYKIDNVWSSKQINFTDKITFLKYARLYENLKERRKAEQRENNSQIGKRKSVIDTIKSKNPVKLLNKIKIEQIEAKSVEELTKEVAENQNKNDFENYQFEEYTQYKELTEQEAEEQRIKLEQQEMLKEQLRLKQELKEKKAKEKAEKRAERIRKREENKKNREIKRQKAREEARIEEELSEDNLYPKTKYNKSL